MIDLSNIHSTISGTMILGIVVGVFVFGHCIIYAATHDYETGRRLPKTPCEDTKNSNRVLLGHSRIAFASDTRDYANNYIDTGVTALYTSTINNTKLVRVKCEYCESLVPADKINCPNCGAPIKCN